MSPVERGQRRGREDVKDVAVKEDEDEDEEQEDEDEDEGETTIR